MAFDSTRIGKHPLNMGGVEYLSHQAYVKNDEMMAHVRNKTKAADKRVELEFYYRLAILGACLENKAPKPDMERRYFALVDAYCAEIAAGRNPDAFNVDSLSDLAN
jgi:hypothetical protein